MTTIRRFEMNDLFKFNNVNLDVLTETYNMTFYLQYMSQWPESFVATEGPHPGNDGLMGYVVSKSCYIYYAQVFCNTFYMLEK